VALVCGFGFFLLLFCGGGGGGSRVGVGCEQGSRRLLLGAVEGPKVLQLLRACACGAAGIQGVVHVR